MSGETPDALAAIIARDSRTAVRALAAAERAVEEGRLNLAKVLRALALAARARALGFERAACGGASAVDLFSELRSDYVASTDALVSLRAAGADGGTGRAAGLAHNASLSLINVLDRTQESLHVHRDVPETVVAQFLWGCAECGYITEAGRPEICPACGSVAGDMELFAPFFSATTERIARRQPAQIVAMLRQAPALFDEALSGVPEADLRRTTGPGEWCMKEIAGHTIDIAELAARRFRAALDPVDASPEPAVLPWKILDGQNYADATPQQLSARFAGAVSDVLTLVEPLSAAGWRKRGELMSGRLPLLDLGSWLANHNVAHLEQIRALRPG